jgi:hypothetical protein
LEQIEWHPQIGDPTFAGWLTVFSYFLAAVLAYRVQRQLPPDSHAQHRLFWRIIAITCLLLGINKQLDLQSLLTAIGRYFAHRQGWYDNRQRVQIAFILTAATTGLALLVWGVNYFYGCLRQNALAFAGILFLIVFILIRASSFHHMDHFIGSRILGLKFNWLLELSGIYCIVLNALWLDNRMKKRH